MVMRYSSGQSRKHKRQTKKRRYPWVQILKELREHTPCADCHKKHPHYQMEFDHCYGIKWKSPSVWAMQGRVALLFAEMMLCDLVCRNCHGKRTWARYGKILVVDEETGEGKLISLGG